jgi:chitodextrinase
MTINKFIALLCVSTLVFGSFTNAYAIEDQFEIGATVTSSDVTAPSVPTGLSATAVSSSQINLSWSVSTDDVAVTGYKIYRDSVFLTTTSLSTHSDTGLSPSTTYSYTVSAVDAASNESSQSSSANATTFAASSSAGGGSGQHSQALIYDLVVVPSQTGAIISWKTTQPAVTSLAWGKSNNYELGTSVGTIYTSIHSASLISLDPGTQYFYSIEVTNGYGTKTFLSNLTFTTLPMGEFVPNPTDFKAQARQADIALSWTNPKDPDFEEVRLLRSTVFFPANPSDGQVIYEGDLEGIIDSDVNVGVTYYYSIFARDRNGLYSSGSVARARVLLPGEVVGPDGNIYDELPKSPTTHPLIDSLTFLDFDFIQDGRRITTFSGKSQVTVDGGKNLTVSLDYEKVPELLKSIIVTLTHPSDKEKTFSFLLRVNDEKTKYVATIGPLGESGIYNVYISIVDYKNQGLKQILGNLLATALVGLEKENNVYQTLLTIINKNRLNILLIILVSLILFKSLRSVIDRNRRRMRVSNINV